MYIADDGIFFNQGICTQGVALMFLKCFCCVCVCVCVCVCARARERERERERFIYIYSVGKASWGLSNISFATLWASCVYVLLFFVSLFVSSAVMGCWF